MNKEQTASEDDAERLHCAEVLNAPNPFGIRSTVHFCLALHTADGETVRNVVINLDRWSFTAAIAEEFQRDPDAQSRAETIIARSAANEYMRRDGRVNWARGERLA